MNFKTKTAIDVFNDWAKTGKDEGMKKNHFPAFQEVKKLIKKYSQNKAILADVGCGNGWGTDNLNSEEFIDQAMGYDGSPKMIEKAKKNYPNTQFFNMDLNSWAPNQSFDVVYSMEVLYYLESPSQFIKNCYQKWLNAGGLFICAIDHYQENQESLSWPKDLNVNMKTKTSNQWKNILEENKFKNCNIKHVNQNKDWNGTLIFWGIKNVI